MDGTGAIIRNPFALVTDMGGLLAGTTAVGSLTRFATNFLREAPLQSSYKMPRFLKRPLRNPPGMGQSLVQRKLYENRRQGSALVFHRRPQVGRPDHDRRLILAQWTMACSPATPLAPNKTRHAWREAFLRAVVALEKRRGSGSAAKHGPLVS